jgi:membrane peptidoglycan carboxypeptidase
MANSIQYGKGNNQSTFNIAANGRRQAGSTMKVIDMGAIKRAPTSSSVRLAIAGS